MQVDKDPMFPCASSLNNGAMDLSDIMLRGVVTVENSSTTSSAYSFDDSSLFSTSTHTTRRDREEGFFNFSEMVVPEYSSSCFDVPTSAFPPFEEDYSLPEFMFPLHIPEMLTNLQDSICDFFEGTSLG